MANRRNLTIADGTVAASATEIATGPSDQGGRVNVSFANTGTAEEVVILTITRGTGTARRLKRFTLGPDEQADLNGQALNKDDSLKASSTNAEVVDYVVSIAPEDTPFSFEIQDADGIRKNMGTLNEALFQGTYNAP